MRAGVHRLAADTAFSGIVNGYESLSGSPAEAAMRLMFCNIADKYDSSMRAASGFKATHPFIEFVAGSFSLA